MKWINRLKVMTAMTFAAAVMLAGSIMPSGYAQIAAGENVGDGGKPPPEGEAPSTGIPWLSGPRTVPSGPGDLIPYDGADTKKDLTVFFHQRSSPISF